MKDGNLMEALENMDEEEITFTERDAANMIRAMLKGIAYMHQSDYMHRDIKLENIMVHKTTDMNKKTIFVPSFTDFGMATSIKDDEVETLSVGTPLYMAPEILRNDAYNKAADIWSLGVVFYILLTS